MKTNYHNLMLEECDSITDKPRLLLHVCCAICAATALSILPKYFDVYVYFYNPNIHPESEYNKRFEALKELIEKANYEVTLIDTVYNPDEFYEFASEYSTLKEGGERCKLCYDFRLKETAMMAETLDMDYFATAITQSPMKNVDIINEIGKKYSGHVKYLVSDFKKDNGFLYGNNLTKELGIYRQNYCGCEYSFRD